MVWSPLGQDRMWYRHPDGFLVVRPRDAIEPVPLFCPVCGLAMLTSDDSDAHRQDGCCDLCRMVWVVPRRAEWSLGWRPSSADLGRVRARRTSMMPRR